jgi:arylsulfatase
VPAFTRNGAVKREPVFWHHQGNRALRDGDWKIVSARDDADAWRLYNLATDRAESDDLAARQPERLRQMSARWQQLEDEFRREAGPVEALNPGKKKTKSR